MSNYGEEGIKLCKQAIRRQDMITRYEHQTVQNIINESIYLKDDQSCILDAANNINSDSIYSNHIPETLSTYYVLHHFHIQSNKRCLLAYHANRANRITSLLNQLGTAQIPAEAKENMSNHEIEFANGYRSLFNSYSRSVRMVEINKDFTSPPKEVFVTVKVNKHLGEIVTASGVKQFDKGSRHFIQRTDVDHLLNLGYVSLV